MPPHFGAAFRERDPHSNLLSWRKRGFSRLLLRVRILRESAAWMKARPCHTLLAGSVVPPSPGLPRDQPAICAHNYMHGSAGVKGMPRRFRFRMPRLAPHVMAILCPGWGLPPSAKAPSLSPLPTPFRGLPLRPCGKADRLPRVAMHRASPRSHAWHRNTESPQRRIREPRRDRNAKRSRLACAWDTTTPVMHHAGGLECPQAYPVRLHTRRTRKDEP